jgi:hypothetical protein
MRAFCSRVRVLPLLLPLPPYMRALVGSGSAKNESNNLTLLWGYNCVQTPWLAQLWLWLLLWTGPPYHQLWSRVVDRAGLYTCVCVHCGPVAGPYQRAAVVVCVHINARLWLLSLNISQCITERATMYTVCSQGVVGGQTLTFPYSLNFVKVGTRGFMH